MGFGPFRWVCTSADPRDLAVTDDIAATVLEEIGADVTDHIRQQYNDNIRWIREAGKHKMVLNLVDNLTFSLSANHIDEEIATTVDFLCVFL